MDGVASPAPLTNEVSAAAAERLYLEHRQLLLWIAWRKFGVPHPDAENLVQETLLAFLTTRISIDDPKAWLVAAMCNASRHYWRRLTRAERVGEGAIAAGRGPLGDDTVERLEREILVRKVLAMLRPGDREVLRLHYFEQSTATEIARLRNTTRRYAEKIICKALKRARRIYERLHDPTLTR